MSKVKLAIVFTVLIDVIGVGIVIPVMPFYVESFNLRPFFITLFFAVFSVCSFISAPFLGALSDRIGRRPVLITSILSTSLGWFVFALSSNVLFLFLGRIIDGIAAGNISTAQSYLVDISKNKKERTTNLGLIGAAFGIGFVIGPFLGGLLSSFSPKLPFYTVGFLAFLNAILAYLFLPETNHRLNKEKKLNYNPLFPIIRAISRENLRISFFIWFLFMLSISSMQSVFALYAGNVFGLGSMEAGMLFAMFGLVVAFNQGVALKRFWLKYFSEKDLEMWLLLFCAVGFLLVGIKFFWIFILGQIVLAFGQSILRVVMTSQIVGNVAENSQGEALGMLNSVMSLAMIIGPILAGFIFEKKYNGPFFLSSVFVLIAFILLFNNRKRLEKLEKIKESVTTL